MSLLIFTQIAAVFPSALWQIRLTNGWDIFAIILLIGFVVVAAVVFVEQAQRRIPVQYAKRMVGRRSYGGTSTYIPLKVNQAGVIPVIFASSLLYLPALIVQFTDGTSELAAVDLDHVHHRAPARSTCSPTPRSSSSSRTST